MCINLWWKMCHCTTIWKTRHWICLRCWDETIDWWFFKSTHSKSFTSVFWTRSIKIQQTLSNIIERNRGSQENCKSVMLLGSAQWSIEKTTVCTVCEAFQTILYTHTFCTLLKMQFVVNFAVPLITVPESKTLTDCNSSLSLRYLTLKMSVFSGLLSKHKRSKTIIEQSHMHNMKRPRQWPKLQQIWQIACTLLWREEVLKTVRKIVQINHQRQGICNVVPVCSFMRQSWGKKKQLLKNNIEASKMYL
jgi:hypothetical protein